MNTWQKRKPAGGLNRGVDKRMLLDQTNLILLFFVNRFGIIRDMAEYRLTITAMYGKEIYHTKYLNPTAELISNVIIPARIYFIEVRKGKKVSVQKSIKQ